MPPSKTATITEDLPVVTSQAVGPLMARSPQDRPPAKSGSVGVRVGCAFRRKFGTASFTSARAARVAASSITAAPSRRFVVISWMPSDVSFLTAEMLLMPRARRKAATSWVVLSFIRMLGVGTTSSPSGVFSTGAEKATLGCRSCSVIRVRAKAARLAGATTPPVRRICAHRLGRAICVS